MSAKQKTIVIMAIFALLCVCIFLFVYSMTHTGSYDGIFVSGVRQVWSGWR